MPSLLSSPARLTDPNALAALKRLFRRHGALPGAVEVDDGPVDQLQVFLVVPLVFGLMPADALNPANAQHSLKPLVRAHLDRLGVPRDEELVSILQVVLYHYTSTMDFPRRPMRRKLS